MKKLLALFLTLALLLSIVPMAIGASAAETTDPAYKFVYDAGEKFRTSYDSGREATATIKFDYYLKSGSVKVYGSENGEQKGYLEEGEGSFELSVDSKSFWIDARNSAAAELYIWNVELTQGGSALDFASYTGRTTCDFSTITYGEIPFPNVEDEEPEIVGTGDYAIYFDSSISNNFWVTQRNSSNLEIGMEEPNLPAGNTYTVEFDVYSLTLGSNVVFGATQATWSTTSAIGDSHQVWKNAPANVNEWTHYSFNVTTTADWKGVMFYVIDDADGFTGYIDNLTIKDSQGTVVSSFEPTADDISNKSNCASIVELSADVAYAKNPDYAVYIDNSANDIQSNQIWFNLLGMPKLQLPAGKTYTLKFDNYALSTSYKGHLYIPIHSTGGGITGQNWWNTTDTLNGWATQSVTFTIEADKEALAYHTLYVGAGFKGYLDNFRVYDGDTEVAKLEFDASNLGKENSGATVVLLPVDIANAKPCIHVYDNACDATCNLCEEVRGVAGHVYDGSWDTDCNECGAVREVTDYAMYIDNSANTIQSDAIWFNVLGMSKLSLDPGKTYTLKFDNYALLVSTSGHMYQPVNSTGSSVTGQNWFSTNDVVNGWATQSIQFTIPAENEALAYHKLHVGAGFKGYLDNFRVYDGDTLVTRFEFVANDKESAGATVVELPAEIEYDKNPNYAVLIDNSKGTGFGQLYLNEVGMAHDKVYPVGDYTIKFDFYALKIVDNKNIVACMAAAGWSGNAFPGSDGQVWLEIADKTDEWQTLSFDVTTVKDGQFPNFHIGAGLKGYFDNYQIIDKSTGETVLNFSPVAADVGKVSKTICEVVKVPCNPSDIECEHEYDNDCDTTCNLCEEVREVGAHVYENYVSNNDATCTANGTETGTCACGATDTREDADSKLEHTYKDIVDTDCNECGAIREVPQDVINGCTVSPVFGRGTVSGLPLDSCVQPHSIRLYTAYTYERANYSAITVGEGCRVYVQFFKEDGSYLGGQGWKFAGTYTMAELGYGNAKYFKITFDSADGATTPPETGLTLTLNHVYSGLLDADCDNCGAEREVAVDTVEGCTVHPVLDKGTVNGGGNVTLDNCVASHATRLYTAYTYERANYSAITVGADARIYVQFFNADGSYSGGSGWKSTGTYTMAELGYGNAKYFKITYSGTAGGNDVATPDPAGLTLTLKHNFENYVSNNDATCTANGTETGTCACGATDTREVADSKLDHTYENYTSNNDATCTANGTETGTCACGATDTREDADSMIDHYYRDEFDAFCDGCDAIREINYPAESVELKEIDGVKYIYVNGRTSVEGLFKVGDDYYYATWGGVVLTGDQYVTRSYCDIAGGKHLFFAEDGKMVVKGFATVDGVKKLYIDGRTSVEGLFEVDGKYYLATWGGVVLTDGRYYVTESFVEGIDAGKNFTVDADGAVLDGIVEIDGQKYLYDFGTTVVPGDYTIGETIYTATWGGLIVE